MRDILFCKTGDNCFIESFIYVRKLFSNKIINLCPKYFDHNFHENDYPLLSVLSYHIPTLNKCQEFTSKISINSFIDSTINIEKNQKYSTVRILDTIAQNLFFEDDPSASKPVLDLLIKRFEIRRKIHEYYRDPQLIDSHGGHTELCTICLSQLGFAFGFFQIQFL